MSFAKLLRCGPAMKRRLSSLDGTFQPMLYAPMQVQRTTQLCPENDEVTYAVLLDQRERLPFPPSAGA